MLLLLVAGNEKVRGSGDLQWHNIHITFRENRSVCSRVGRGKPGVARFFP